MECEIAEVDVGRRMRKLVAEDAASGHPILQNLHADSMERIFYSVGFV